MNLSRPRTIAAALGISALAASCSSHDAPISILPTPDAGPVAPVCSVSYPAGPYGIAVGETLPDAAFLASDGAPATLGGLRNCAGPRLLVVRIGAPWSGPTRYHWKNDVLADPALASSLRRLDVLVADRDNHAATAEAARAFASEFPGTAPPVADRDGAYTAFDIAPVELPWFLFVDTWTMQLLATEGNPSPVRLRYRVEHSLARLAGTAAPPYPSEPLIDDLFDPYEWALLRETELHAAAQTPLPDATNPWAEDPAAAALGARLFDDASLAPAGTVSCKGCHDPALGFDDRRPRALGVALGDRKSPRIGQIGTARNFFWDGRAKTLAAQALGPFENPKEFGSDRCFVLKQIAAKYRDSWAAVFGPLLDTGVLPDRCAPGAGAALATNVQEAVDRTFSNVGNAIAAYERTFRLAPNRVDRYLAGDASALTASERTGLHHFGHDGCLQCHWGPRFSDDAFHAVRFPGLAAPRDLGRGALAEALARGGDAAKPGTFKTPALRGVATSNGFGHSGALVDLRAVAHVYRIAGAPAEDATAVGVAERWIQKFHEENETPIADFLGALRGDAQ